MLSNIQSASLLARVNFQKTYKLYDPIDKKKFFGGDVIFDELANVAAKDISNKNNNGTKLLLRSSKVVARKPTIPYKRREK
jgi:hypothetical protein